MVFVKYRAARLIARFSTSPGGSLTTSLTSAWPLPLDHDVINLWLCMSVITTEYNSRKAMVSFVPPTTNTCLRPKRCTPVMADITTDCVQQQGRDGQSGSTLRLPTKWTCVLCLKHQCMYMVWFKLFFFKLSTLKTSVTTYTSELVSVTFALFQGHSKAGRVKLKVVFWS